MNRIPHNFNDDSEDRDSSLQQSSTGAQKNQYNLNAVPGKFGKFELNAQKRIVAVSLF